MRTVKRILPFEDNPAAFLAADLLVIALALFLGFGLVQFVDLSNQAFIAEAPVSTSLSALPGYALLSLVRSLIALLLSYAFAVTYGTIASRNRACERVMIPVLDVLQSLPVVSFMPGFVLALTTLFPGSRWGLELACILMIFTGQVWNLVFAWYESQCALPTELKDVTSVFRLSAPQRFFLLDLPNGIRPLVYNGMMSMAGGWFFLTLCEAFWMGGRSYRLPGLGSFMSAAFSEGNNVSFVAGLVVMACIIVSVDFFLWKPLIAWSARFRNITGQEEVEQSLFLRLLERTRLPRMLSQMTDWLMSRHETSPSASQPEAEQPAPSPSHHLFSTGPRALSEALSRMGHWTLQNAAASRPRWRTPLLSWGASFGAGALVFYLLPELPRLASAMASITHADWLRLTHSVLLTFGKILGVLTFATLWTVPAGIWIGMNPRVAKVAQPIVQNIAAFPAPMLFPLLAMKLSEAGLPPQLIAMILMTIGNQWYLFFNVIAGASRISAEHRTVAKVYGFSLWKRWRYLYIPAIFPSLVTGWITATGGSWNTSIVAELVQFRGGEMRAQGIGLELQTATMQFNTVAPLVAAILVVTIALVVLNRSLWRTLHMFAERLKAA